MSVATMFEEATFNEVHIMDAPEAIDPIEEIRLRTWARQNYLPHDERDSQWHPVVLDEMRQKDNELEE